jgi:hypothetical protein
MAEDWSEFLHEILSITETAIDTRESDKSDFVQLPQVLHAQIADLSGCDLALVVIENVRFNLNGKLLNRLLLDLSLPTG